MSDFDRAVQGLRTLRPDYRNPRIKVTGFLNLDGTIGANPIDGAQPGYLWVHGYPRGANVQVIAGAQINPSMPNMRVWVGENQANEAVAYAAVIDRRALAQVGAVLPALMQPAGADELVGRSIPSTGFTPGRLEPSQLGGMFIHVRSFRYDEGYFDDGSVFNAPTLHDFSLAGYTPVTVGYSQWNVIAFDPTDATFHVYANTPQGIPASTLSEDSINTAAVPSGMYLLGAVGLDNGQTVINASSRFADVRYFLSPKGDVDEEWIVDYAAVVPLAANAFIPRGIRIASTGSLTVTGSLFIG